MDCERIMNNKLLHHLAAMQQQYNHSPIHTLFLICNPHTAAWINMIE
jgi:hypothetical protein